MKTTTMTNLVLLASLTLFTACSSKTVEPDKQNVRVSLENLPLAQTYPIVQEYQAPIIQQSYVQNIIPQYQRPQAVVNNYAQPRVNPTSYIHPPYRSNAINLTHRIEGDAKKLLGKKYVWGATGPRTYDCSGFTQKIFRDAGINIPRVSRNQAKVGQYISYNNMQKGDLLFFDTHKKKTGKVTHVGIYLGDGNFIHASSGAKKIVIFNLNEKKFYKNRFLWARRVIKPSTHLAMK